jgi:RHS repeat-associated protein
MMVRNSKGALLIILALLSFALGLPIRPSSASSSTQSQSQGPTGSGLQTPNQAGVDPVQDIRLAEPRLSSVDTTNEAAGLVQNSSGNFTLRNSKTVLRLLGDGDPRDEILGHVTGIANSFTYWGVEVSLGGAWFQLVPTNTRLIPSETNRTGAYLTRSTEMQFGNYSGTLKVTYKALASGPLKWDLEFIPKKNGWYQLTFLWENVTSGSRLLQGARQFLASYRYDNYTLSWTDIPNQFNVTTRLVGDNFFLRVDLGNLPSGSPIRVDPQLVDISNSNMATAFTFQRKVFYDGKNGNYWVFYYDGQNNVIRYRYSHDGSNWYPSPGFTLPYWYPAFSTPEASMPSISVLGQTVIVAAGSDQTYTGIGQGLNVNATLTYVIGTIQSSFISWGNTIVTKPISTPRCNFGGGCTITAGIRYVSTAWIPDSATTATPAISFNWYANSVPYQSGYQSPDPCNTLGGFGGSSYWSYSYLYEIYKGNTEALGFSNGDVGGCYRYDLNDQFRSVILPAAGSGGARVIFEQQVEGSACTGQPASNTTELCSEDADSNGNVLTSSAQIIQQSIANDAEFSADSDANFGTHVIYHMPNGSVSYVYRPPGGYWSAPQNPFASIGGTVTYPSLTIDYSSNDIYAFAVVGGYVYTKTKTLAQSWSDRTSVILYYLGSGVTNLGSNFATWSGTNSSQISIIWTQNDPTAGYDVELLSFPLNPVWSPFATPTDPWDGNGITAFGEYFSNLGEQVSTSTGLLTIRQTDFIVPGRGLDLNISRVYIEPYSFYQYASTPVSYESYPWAPMGNGWQLNFPWMNNVNTPLYLHLWNGQGYRIPSSFWSGATATWENNQGEDFRLVRNNDATIALFDKHAVMYNFDQSHALRSITDATGVNTILFSYSGGTLSTISDTLEHSFCFIYSGNLLHSVNQTSGGCTSNFVSVRGIVFNYSGTALTGVTDPGGRTTTYQYPDSWRVSTITYPTGWHTSYNYATYSIGTGDIVIYRVSSQTLFSTSNSQIRAYNYNYVLGAGGSVAGNVVNSYNGTQWAGTFSYSFSYAGMVRNVTDSSGNLVSSVQRLFGVQGEPIREIVLVTDGAGKLTGSYTNYYSYDKWGNQIYSRKAIGFGRSHETFNSFYNDGVAPGFYAFQDTFSQNQGTLPDNSWNITNGHWMVKNGMYNGTETSGSMENMVSSNNIGLSDLSLQTRVYIGRQVNLTTANVLPRLGIFAHYTGNKYKWALDLANETSAGNFLELHDEWNQWLGGSAKTACPLIKGAWYTFNMTVHGFAVTGWVSTPGYAACLVSGTFPTNSPAAGGTGFGLSAGGYSALFDDVKVATVSPNITQTGFSNSFDPNGAPVPGLGTWLVTTKPPDAGWNTTLNWLPATGWDTATPVQDFNGGTTWNQGPPYYLHGWYDNAAQWIWATAGANISASADPVWFRRVFNLTTGTYLTIQATVDDAFTLYVDGNLCTRGTLWIYPGTCNTAFLSPGIHLIAVNATNSNGPDPAGFLLSATVYGTRQVLFRTDAKVGPVIPALAGTAELQNGSGSASVEKYYSYKSWGEVSLERRLYSSSSQGNQWLTSSISYDTYGNPTISTDPRGNSTYYAYSGLYQNAYLTNLTNVVGTQQVTHLYSYDPNTGNILSETDPLGNPTTYQRDVLGRITRIAYPQGLGYVSYTYNDKGNYVDIVNENGWKTRQIYDGLGRLAITDQFQGQNSYANQTYTHNWQNKVSTSDDALGDSYRYQYDILGRPIAALQPDNNVTKEYYNDTAPWVRTTRQDGSYKCSFSDRLGRLISSVEYSDASCNPLALASNFFVTNYQYDQVGNLVSTTNSGYNGIVNPGFETGDFSGWVATGSMYIFSLPNSPPITVHSGSNSAVGGVGGCGTGNFTLTQTFSTPKPGSSVQSLQFWYWEPYDSLASAQVLYSDGTVGQTLLPQTSVSAWSLMSLTFSLSKQITGIRILETKVSCQQLYLDDFTLTTPETNSYTYDNLNHLVKTSYPDGTSESYWYDNMGNLVYKTDRANVETMYTYDSLERLTNVVDCSTLITRVYAYDKNSNLLQAQNRNNTIAYGYDALNRMTSETYTVDTGTSPPTPPGVYSQCPPPGGWPPGSGGGGGTTGGGGGGGPKPQSPTGGPLTASVPTQAYTVRYTYIGEALNSILYPDLLNTTYTYDGLGRVATVYNPATPKTPAYATLSYNQNGAPTSIAYGNGLLANYAYDSLARVSQIKVANTKANLLLLNYAYYKPGTVASVVGNSTSTTGNLFTVNEQYNYDPLQRLTGSTVTSGNAGSSSGTSTNSLSFVYDYLGNRWQQTLNGQVMNNNYNPANNELSSSSKSGLTLPSSYDADGNLVTKNVTTTSQWKYSWNVLGNLIYVTNNTGTQGWYEYDGLSRRVESREGPSDTLYAYLGTETLYQATNAHVSDMLYAEGLRVANVTSQGIYYYHQDGLGSVRLITDSTTKANVVYSDNYQPFGQDNGVPGGVASNTYRYTDRQWSSGVGLYYDNQRWYDPAQGRFISTDPLPGYKANPQSLNPYVYVVNQPTRLRDPSGMTFCWEGTDCEGGGLAGGSNPLTGNDVTDTNIDPVQISNNDLQTNPLTPEQASQNIESSTVEGNLGGQAGLRGQSSDYKFVGTSNGYLVRVPANWESRVANNGQGLVVQDPTVDPNSNANMIRIMDPTTRYPEGYVVYYNEQAQPLDIYGGVSSGPEATHIPLNYIGPLPAWP